MKQNVKEKQRALRIRRTRAKITGTGERPRLSVRRSLKHIYAQVVDDARGVTVASASDVSLSADAATGKTKSETAFLVGKALAEAAKAAGVASVVFDRRDRRYHGRIRALAEGAREGGLTF